MANKKRETRTLPGRDPCMTSLHDLLPSGETFDPVDVWNCLTQAFCIGDKNETFESAIEQARRQNQGIVHRQKNQELRDIALHRGIVARQIRKLNEQLGEHQISHDEYTTALNQLHDGATAEMGGITVLRNQIDVLRARRSKSSSLIERIVLAVSKKHWTVFIVGGVLLGAAVLVSRKKILV